LDIWMETGRMNCSQKPDKKCKKLIFDNIPELQIQPSTSQMDQMTTSRPPIIIIWSCWRMIVWTSRILVGSMDGDWQNDWLFSEARQEMQKVDFWQHPWTSNPTQHITNGPDDHLTTTNYHHMVMLKDDCID
jgi:hypothetical protein